MSTNLWIASLSVLWMGILATLSPCPLGTNVAAVSIIAGGGGKTPQSALLTAGAYGIGRMITHAVLGMLIMKGFASASGTVAAMQSIPAKISGPIFIILGVILSGWIEIPMPKIGAVLRKKVLGRRPSGPWRTFLVGCIFSLIPCPETAALFFGGMLPLAMENNSLYVLPLLFGLGTGLPVMLIGLLLSMGIGSFANSLGDIKKKEAYLRILTSITFTSIGLYLTLTHIYQIF